MEYMTIRQKVKKQFADATGMECFCGKRINKNNIRYYYQEYGELKPICKDCAKVVKPFLEII